VLITVLLLLRHLIYPTMYYVFIGYRRPRRKTLSGSLKLPFPALSLKGHTMSMFAMLHGVSPEFLRSWGVGFNVVEMAAQISGSL